MGNVKRRLWSFLFVLSAVLLKASFAFASEADIRLPDLSTVGFNILGAPVSGIAILNTGLLVCLVGLFFGLLQYSQTKALPAHKQMLAVSNTIWETCKTYLTQQGKFLLALWILIALCIIYYFGALGGMPAGSVIVILLASVLGILGSYGVAWFGIRINTVANFRAAFASLQGNPLNIVNICLRSGMSVGLLLVSV
ncbi:MAG TPA: sodium/proton-translocating pyrophosphatase, partial [Deltaproteobacteria bacterium]|nr:sodium/proton-translocating pyrophosphatase [Deltaproteobacteria bacterium]